MQLQELLDLTQERTLKVFAHYLKEAKAPSALLQEAMIYSVMNGGKRIRPALVYIVGYVTGAKWEDLDAAACAVELIHSYSLVHDDLPAMDNADLRRGKPSCHKQYNEAMAILAGDALQALVFQILAEHPSALNPDQRLRMISNLSKASGPFGMAGGQALDITIMNKDISLQQLVELYSLKTGALLTVSAKLGAIASQDYEATWPSLKKYADCLGLAFQIQDDLLDLYSETEALGKPAGIDAKNNKVTYPMLAGTENSQRKIADLTEEALSAVVGFERKAVLIQLADYLLKRQN